MHHFAVFPSGKDKRGFCLALNLAELGAKQFALERTAEARRRGIMRARGPARILIVENDAPVRSMTGLALQQQGHAVHFATNGYLAMDALQNDVFDLVLTDILMRDGNGVDLLDRVSAEHPTIPVVIITAVQDIRVAIDTMRRGAYDYLLKPFDRQSLVKSVVRALDQRQTLVEEHSYQRDLEQIVRARTELLCQVVEDLEHSYDITLEALGDALDLKDSETEGHSKRVTAYTIALARAAGISPADIKVIARGAFLHDIGKMAIPDGILRKPDKLTPQEQVIMREHCALGYQILAKIPFLAESAEIVHCHQEFFDGGGYPRGLQGHQIPIGARLFAIADTLDAITSDRPYRKSRTFEHARAEIHRCSGTQFDPGVVEIFLRIPDELWLELRAEINGQNRRFLAFDLSDHRGTPNGPSARS
jgi:putative nucleotidyltransferase with HDIG domain